MRIEWINGGSDAYSAWEQMQVFSDAGEAMSHAGISTVDSRFCGKYVKTMLIGGVGTDPRFRRMGCVREMFNEVFSLAPERGWAVSMLHPFSASYYRKFGYEKISDHKIVEFPMAQLAHIPRCPDLVPYDESRQDDVIALYEAFGAKRNIMFRRYNGAKFGGQLYIRYDDAGNPAGYVKLRGENYYDINRMVSVNLHVEELVFTTPQALWDLFGFLRMYEGEFDTVKIHNCAMAPETDSMIREYVGVKYTLVSDIMARVLNVKAMLEANRYPDAAGHFRVYVDDTLDFTRGLWEVEYSRGQAEAKKLPDEGAWDMYAPMPAFTQMLYGYEHYTADTACYLPGVKMVNECSDFFRAFTKKYNGLFEHF